MRLRIPATSAKNADSTIYVAIDEGSRCRVSEFKNGRLDDMISLQGSPCIFTVESRRQILGV